MLASDADREKVASILRDAYVEGRLTAVEHEERPAPVFVDDLRRVHPGKA